MNAISKLAIVAVCFLGLSGCIFPTQPDITVTQYTLTYQPPGNYQLDWLPGAIRISRFTSAREFNTQSMLFSPGPGMQQAYNYSHWRVFPADLIGDFLTRDMRQAGLIKVTGTEFARFRLDGAVDEFWRVDWPGASRVRMVITCTLIDRQAERNITEQLMFQRTYIQEMSVDDDSPLSMALAMSRAMAAFSRQIQDDIYTVIQERLNRTE